MTNPRNKNGFTIVELLVVAAIVGILLSLITAYFSQQANVTRQTQARQEAEIKARTVAELLVQDLQVAGSSVIFNGGVSNNVQIGCSAGGITKCIKVLGGGSGTQDRLTVFYATSLRPDKPCRRVDFKINGNNTLQRLEQSRSSADCSQLLLLADPDAQAFNPTAFADNILSLDIKYTCADDTVVDDPTTCYGASFPRQATVTVLVRADELDTVTSQVTLTTSMPNLRY